MCGPQECYKGPKFSFVNDDDTFTLIIKNPETADTGRYNCVVRECNDLTCKGYLEVEREYFIIFLTRNEYNIKHRVLVSQKKKEGVSFLKVTF
jgi:hypothetical protein